MPIGEITRGTTNTNRLRRVDRWIAELPILHKSADPLIVDLGFGASAVTCFELHQRLSQKREDLEVIGLEISTERVQKAQEQLQKWQEKNHTGSKKNPLSFAVGGFEIPLPEGRKAAIIRAFNVLRQYDESDVLAAWKNMIKKLQPHGMLIEGTCDELGRVCSWLTLNGDGPQTLTLSLSVNQLEHPSVVAERLPKILIHRNVSGEKIHSLLTALDEAWQRNAALSPYGARQRWLSSVQSLRETWHIQGSAARWRLGELTVPWATVCPKEFERKTKS